MTSWIRANANGAAVALSVIGVWLWTWRHLAIEWRFNDQYTFGYAVPWLAGFLAWQRLRQASWTSPLNAVPAARSHWRMLMWLAVPLFFVAELLRRQDPTWRLVGWLMTAAATLLTVGWLGQIGGRSLVRTLVLPLAFLWLTLPWPSMLETPLTLGLLRVVTQITTDALNWMGVAALQRGNTIELRNCIVGVDTACSGVQSFQAALMAALFIGEFLALSVGRRVVLLAGGVFSAFAANLARVFALARAGSNEGEAAIDRLHDPTGALATAAMIAGIFFLGWLLGRGHGRGPSSLPRPPWPQWRLSGSYGLVLLAAFTFAPLAAKAWFRAGVGGPSVEQRTPLWTVKTAGLPAGWSVKPDRFTPTEIRLLRFTQATAVEFRSLELGPADLLHFFWAPEATVPSQAFSHTPEICLPSAGWQRVGPPMSMTVNVGGVPIHGALFEFSLDGIKQIVFHAIWYGGESRPYGGPLGSAIHRGRRFALLWSAPARLGHETLTVYMPGGGGSRVDAERVGQVLQTVLAPANRGDKPEQTKRE